MWLHQAGGGDQWYGQFYSERFQSGGTLKNFCCAPPLFLSTNTISRFGERFRDGQNSLVSFLSAVLLMVSPDYIPTSTWLVTSSVDTSIRAYRDVLFDKLYIAKMHRLDTANVSRQDGTWRAKWNLGLWSTCHWTQEVQGDLYPFRELQQMSQQMWMYPFYILTL